MRLQPGPGKSSGRQKRPARLARPLPRPDAWLPSSSSPCSSRSSLPRCRYRPRPWRTGCSLRPAAPRATVDARRPPRGSSARREPRRARRAMCGGSRSSPPGPGCRASPGLRSGRDFGTLRPLPASSNGRTADFGSAYWGSNPYAGTARPFRPLNDLDGRGVKRAVNDRSPLERSPPPRASPRPRIRSYTARPRQQGAPVFEDQEVLRTVPVELNLEPVLLQHELVLLLDVRPFGRCVARDHRPQLTRRCGPRRSKSRRAVAVRLPGLHRRRRNGRAQRDHRGMWPVLRAMPGWMRLPRGGRRQSLVARGPSCQAWQRPRPERILKVDASPRRRRRSLRRRALPRPRWDGIRLPCHGSQRGPSGRPEGPGSRLSRRHRALSARGPRALGARREGSIDSLASLVDREVLASRTESRFAGEVKYAFRHGLLRDAAYGIGARAEGAGSPRGRTGGRPHRDESGADHGPRDPVLVPRRTMQSCHCRLPCRPPDRSYSRRGELVSLCSHRQVHAPR